MPSSTRTRIGSGKFTKAIFEAGCDAVETNTFNGNSISLDEFGMADKLEEINRLNIRLAKQAAAKYTTPQSPAIRRRVDRARHQDAVDADRVHLRRFRYDWPRPIVRKLPLMIEEGVDAIADRDLLRHPPSQVRGHHRHRGNEEARRANCR